MKTLLQTLLGPFDVLLGSIPLAAGRWVIVGFFCAVAFGTMLVPRDFVFREIGRAHV